MPPRFGLTTADPNTDGGWNTGGAFGANYRVPEGSLMRANPGVGG